MTPPPPRVVSLQAGPVREEQFGSKRMTTAIRKATVAGIRRIGTLGVEGDQQADLRCHGGPSRALCCYVREHQETWSRTWGREVLPGEFGENLTIRGLDESTVHIGDRFRFGTALIEIASARGPCATLAARLAVPDVVRLIRANGWTGWYCRVVEEGQGGAGAPLEEVYRHPAAISVAEAYRIKLNKEGPADEVRRLLGVEALCPEWRRGLEARLA